MEYNAGRPIYRQIVDKIKKDIVSGKLKPGERLLSIRQMATELQVNPNTMSRVYQTLENEGITEVQRGMGSHVINDSALIVRLRYSIGGELTGEYVEGMSQLGFKSSEIVEKVKEYTSTRVI